MLNCFVAGNNKGSIPITLVMVKDFVTWQEQQDEATKQWLTVTQFRPETGCIRLFPDKNGNITRVLCCTNDLANLWSVGHLPFVLPEGIYHIENAEPHTSMYAIAWGLGAYQFTRYKKPLRAPAQLVIPEKILPNINAIVSSIYSVRDLINTPTNDLGPTEFSAFAKQLADELKASFTEVVGDDLLTQNYAAIHTVGAASDDAPRLVDIRWGNLSHPKITLVGKGVCFDTGGLDLKPASAMTFMKKDMAGGAHVLGLARMIIAANLPVQLRVLIPMVENSVSGSAYRPGDVIKTRKGLTVEVGNTDAEGRLVLADALTEAVSEKPDLLIDISTLTGAARVALGTELPAVFSNNDELVNALIQVGEKEYDPMWRLPLFSLYREHINSPIADLNNNSTEPYGGAITAALFLKEFVPDDIPWLHFDMMAWNLRTRAGRPQGGEAMCLRAIFSYLRGKYQA